VIHHLLEKEIVSKVITQNIDGLHNFKGDQSKVIQLHGAVENYGICEKCGRKSDIDYLAILRTSTAPVCSKCGSVLRPTVALFGDLIDEDSRSMAYSAMQNCDLLILVGTHCTVDPVLSITSEAKKTGCIVAEINLSAATSASHFVDIRLEGSADDIFREIGKALVRDVSWELLNVEEWTPMFR
jgi:NAD-dependent deacetylase